MYSIFESIAKNNEIPDLIIVLIYSILVILLIHRYFRYFKFFTTETKITYNLFILIGISIIFGYTNFILKYGFSRDLSMINNNIADMVTSIGFAIFAYGYKKIYTAFNKPSSIFLTIGFLIFFAVFAQMRGQGENGPPLYWYWVEYAICIASFTLAVIWGYKSLRYNWFSRLIYGNIILQLISNLVMFVGFIKSYPQRVYIPSILFVGEMIFIASSTLVLGAHILLLRLKK